MILCNRQKTKNTTQDAMLITKFCHKTLSKSLKNFNQARVKSLFDCSNALIRGNELSLTTIGRNLEGRSNVKH
ncbi:MAG: hypothetical protein ACK5MF_18565, partial [Vibrio sp.]